ncbi:hypothetical protein IAU60_006582 [Kwoniella sp. DSM 27419]
MYAAQVLTVALFLLAGTEAHPSPHRRSHRGLEKRAATAATVSGWDYVGCVTEGSKRALPAKSYTDSAMTAELCTSYCKTQGYSLAGLQGWNQCYCDNALRNGLGTSAAAWTCDQTCGGDNTEICGGHWKMSLYQASSGSATPSSSRAATSSARASSSSRAVSSSSRAVSSSSRAVSSSSRAASSSVASSAKPTSSSKPASSSARASTAVLTESVAPVATSYVGCFNSWSGRTLNGIGITSNTITPVTCTRYCTDKGYGFAAVTGGNQCWCGNTLDISKQDSESTCTTPCTADKSYICGGPNRTSVYIAKGGIVPSPSTTTAKPASTVATSSAASASRSASGSVSGSASASASGSSSMSMIAAAASSTIGVAAVPKATGTKALYAHHMVGNTYSYTQDTWADDIAMASGAGIDGFALNYGRDEWQPARLADAYAAAKAANFKMFLSMDVTSLPCASTGDAQNLVNTIATYADHPAQAKVGNATLVSTFAGEWCYFGQGSTTAGWRYLRSLVAAQNITIHLVPAIFSDISTFAGNDWMEGEFNWDSGWPMGSTPVTTQSDQDYMKALGSKSYMAAVSPSFFTYYSPSSYNKNWIYRGDDWLLARRMEQIIAQRNNVDFAEIISWNDYGESHYIGPVRADQPNSQGWTTGMPHTAWLQVIKYYAPAFKTGSYAGASDQLVLWTRPHPKAANPTNPSMARPTGWDNTDDLLYAWITLSSPATVTVMSGSNGQNWNLPAGVSKVSVKSAAGAISAKIVRSGKTVKSYDSTGSFNYTLTPTDFNYNYFVASA